MNANKTLKNDRGGSDLTSSDITPFACGRRRSGRTIPRPRRCHPSLHSPSPRQSVVSATESENVEQNSDPFSSSGSLSSSSSDIVGSSSPGATATAAAAAAAAAAATTVCISTRHRSSHRHLIKHRRVSKTNTLNTQSAGTPTTPPLDKEIATPPSFVVTPDVSVSISSSGPPEAAVLDDDDDDDDDGDDATGAPSPPRLLLPLRRRTHKTTPRQKQSIRRSATGRTKAEAIVNLRVE